MFIRVHILFYTWHPLTTRCFDTLKQPITTMEKNCALQVRITLIVIFTPSSKPPLKAIPNHSKIRRNIMNEKAHDYVKSMFVVFVVTFSL